MVCRVEMCTATAAVAEAKAAVMSLCCLKERMRPCVRGAKARHHEGAG